MTTASCTCLTGATARAYELLSTSEPYRKQFDRAVFLATDDELAVRLIELLRLEWQCRIDDIDIASQIDLAAIDWTQLAQQRRVELLTS